MIRVRAMTTAVSGTPVRPGKTFAMSVLDHLMAAHHLRIVFYYRSEDMRKLKDSLTEALSSYPPVTGRLKRREEDGNWEVKCNDAGVRVLEAKLDVSLDEWLRSARAEELDLTYWEEMPEDPYIWSPFYVQMNEFEGGGLAIGLSCTHMQADPTCATLLVKAWSDMHRQSSIVHPPFFHPPGLQGRINPNTDTKSSKYYAAKSKAKPPSHAKMSTATLKFSDAAVKKCLSDVHMKCSDATPFDVLSALFWSRVVAAKASMNMEGEAQTALSICIDFRKLMHAALPHGYYGNALHFSSVSSTAAEMEEGGLGFVAEIIHHHLSGLDEEEYWSAIDWVESQKDMEGKFAPPFRVYGPELTCANMEHLPAYDVMFDKDVKPVHVAYHVGNVEGEGLILVLPSPVEGLGRTVSVTLPVEQLEKVLSDKAILRLEPTVLFTGKW
ncbi:hypothetical protein MRB53_002372 [Persea americana]|uniref:Uncharacterized protein n=1 Tax=Persea americana TaxID=3435 RepID=A0ACC2MVY2_PERAE|nr:hypothetical protein MRB53_002372 [Persea americana]